LEITEQIKRKYPETKVLILAPRTDSETLLSIKQSGASGYLQRNDPEVLVIYVLRRILKHGTTYFPARLRYPEEGGIPSYDPVLHNTNYALNEEELLILRLIANGLSNKEITLRLGPKANLRYVKATLSKIYVKLGVLSRTEAVAECLRKSIITLEDLI
jgi:DNA-binding NarL/FixJ family response regulator